MTDTLKTGAAGFAASNATAMATDTTNVLDVFKDGVVVPDISNPQGLMNFIFQSIIFVITVYKLVKKPKQK